MDEAGEHIANHSEMFLLELLEDDKIKSEEDHILTPTKGLFQPRPTKFQTGGIKLKAAQSLLLTIADIFKMSLRITSCDKKRIKQIFESIHIWFKWRYNARAQKWEVRGERKRGEDRLVTQKLSSPRLWVALPIPTLIERAVFLVVLKLSTLTSMWFQLWITRLKGGGEALIYSFLLQLCMMCFHWRLWKVFHHASHPEVVKGQNQKELTLSFLL